MEPSFARKLGFRICKTDVNAHKFNSGKFKTFGWIIASLMIDDKDRKSYFFEKTFLLADINMNIALEISFLTLSNVEIYFTHRKLRWSLYTTIETFSTT